MTSTIRSGTNTARGRHSITPHWSTHQRQQQLHCVCYLRYTKICLSLSRWTSTVLSLIMIFVQLRPSLSLLRAGPWARRVAARKMCPGHQRSVWATVSPVGTRQWSAQMTVAAARVDMINDGRPATTMSTEVDYDDDHAPDDPNLDTIYALSSGSTHTATAVAVIRISGPQAPLILQRLTAPRPLPPPRQAVLRQLAWNGQALDQALVLYFAAPRSFTGQDVVELHVHGGRAVVQGVLDALASQSDAAHGVRLAEPGEFTQRAWQAGKLDVLQVEALADLIAANTAAQRQQALQQLDPATKTQYATWKAILVAALAHAEAVIDFGDDEMNTLEERELGDDAHDASAHIWGNVQSRVQELRTSMEFQLRQAARNELVRSGVQVTIVGPPNVGKSSLFNVLSQKDAAIVSNIAGTTRDVLEVSLQLGGQLVQLQDTAGLRVKTDDEIEQVGMERARAAATNAHIVVAMLDATQMEQGLDTLRGVMGHDPSIGGGGGVMPRSRRVLILCNKLDLLPHNGGMSLDAAAVSHRLGMPPNTLASLHAVSCVTMQGLDDFLDALTDLTKQCLQDSSSDDTNGEVGSNDPLLTRARHRQHVLAAVDALARFETLSTQGTMMVDLAAEELRLAASELGRLTGAVDVEDVLDQLFADFCIGK